MKKLLISDNAFKVYSVLLAIFLWVFVVYNQNPESTKLIPGINISYSNASTLEDAGLVILKSERAPTVDVSAKGRRLSLGKLDPSNIVASVTIPEIHEGTYDVNIDVRLPINDVSIVDKKPYTISVKVEKMKKISVPIEIKYTGTSKNPNSAVQAVATPGEISVWGPESVINTVASAQVEYNIGNAVDSEAVAAEYKIISASGADITNNININTNSKTVTLIPSVYETTDLPIKARYSGIPADGYTIAKIEALPANIRLASKDSSPIDIVEVYTETINLSGINQDKKISAKLIIPDKYINVFSVTEAELIVDVEHNITKRFNISSINFENIQQGKHYNAEGLPIEITLSGPESVFAAYIPKAYVDVSALESGTHSLPISLNLPDSITQAEDHYINVTVTDNLSPSSASSPAV